MKQQDEILYEEIFRAFNKAKIDYVVCGGTAVVFFGYTRLTIDLDLIVSLDEKNLNKVYNTLKQLGYKSRAPIRREEFIKKENLEKLAVEKDMKVVSFYNPNDPFKVVDIGVNLPHINEVLKRKKYIKVRNFNIPIIWINDLIKMKEELARPKDLIDVENLKKIKQNQNEK